MVRSSSTPRPCSSKRPSHFCAPSTNPGPLRPCYHHSHFVTQPAELETVMNRTLRIVAILIGVLIVLVVIAPFLIPVDKFRPTIEEKASQALSRKVELGNLSLSLISG